MSNFFSEIKDVSILMTLIKINFFFIIKIMMIFNFETYIGKLHQTNFLYDEFSYGIKILKY